MESAKHMSPFLLEQLISGHNIHLLLLLQWILSWETFCWTRGKRSLKTDGTSREVKTLDPTKTQLPNTDLFSCETSFLTALNMFITLLGNIGWQKSVYLDMCLSVIQSDHHTTLLHWWIDQPVELSVRLLSSKGLWNQVSCLSRQLVWNWKASKEKTSSVPGCQLKYVSQDRRFWNTGVSQLSSLVLLYFLPP